MKRLASLTFASGDRKPIINLEWPKHNNFTCPVNTRFRNRVLLLSADETQHHVPSSRADADSGRMQLLLLSRSVPERLCVRVLHQVIYIVASECVRVAVL